MCSQFLSPDSQVYLENLQHLFGFFIYQVTIKAMVYAQTCQEFRSFFSASRLHGLCSDNSDFLPILFVLFKWATTAPNKLMTISTTNIAEGKYRSNSIHPHNLAVKSIIPKNLKSALNKIIPKLVQFFCTFHLFHANATKLR